MVAPSAPLLRIEPGRPPPGSQPRAAHTALRLEHRAPPILELGALISGEAPDRLAENQTARIAALSAMALLSSWFPCTASRSHAGGPPDRLVSGRGFHSVGAWPLPGPLPARLPVRCSRTSAGCRSPASWFRQE